MQKTFILLAFAIASIAADSDCGEYRFNIKILIDSAGKEVFKLVAQQKTIQTLVNYTRPANSQLGKHRAPDENQKVTITAYIIGLGEERDRDYHLVLANKIGNENCDSMIAEIPDPTCNKLQSYPLLKTKFQNARHFIETNIDATPGGIHWLTSNKIIKVKITGVPFYDKKGHGSVHAKNGIELHPVLDIQPF